MPEGRILREMQDRELTQKCAESKTMQALLATRIEKEELQIELLEQQKKQEAERHKQKMEHEEEWHLARLIDLGVEPQVVRDLRQQRRPNVNNAGMQTSDE